MPENHSKLIEKYFNDLDSSNEGLTPLEANKRLIKYGLNSVGVNNQLTVLKNIFSQFSDLLVIILVIAGTISLFFGEYRDASIMYIIVLINAGIGFYQQYKTEKVLQALKELLPPKSKVIRNNKEIEIDSRYLVIGDIVILQSGNAIPADGIILECYNLKVNESSLTGESHPQKKHQIIGDKIEENEQVFMGTSVVEGEAKILITACGLQTHFGRIAQKTKQIEDNQTPLQKKLHQVGKTVSYIALSVLIGIISWEIIKYRLIDHQAIEPNNIRTIFLFSLALAAALVPEGLPATVSVALSVSASKLAKKNAVIKRLSSVETLGSTTVICTDKTGTLTTGKMGVVKVWTEKDSKISAFSDFDLEKNPQLLENLLFCHNVKKEEQNYFGDINEIALYKGLEEKNIDIDKLIENHQKLHEFSFNPNRKMMSVVIQNSDNINIYTKGAPTVILEKCQLDKNQYQEILKISETMAKEGLRVFAFATKKINSLDQKHYQPEELEKNLEFIGFLGLEDKIRPEVPEAINYCQENGIRIIMITGDYQITAQSIAEEIGLTKKSDLRTIGPEEIQAMSDLELRENLLNNVIFYQAIPEQKLRIVKELQESGEVVAVTGDGVNDSLALKQADIGVAMGMIGTDVAKQSADMILLDDNFATIVNAIKEGRIIWNNLKKFLLYVFSSNAGEFMVAFLGMISGLPIPIMAVQILSVDLGTDILPSFALIFDPASRKELSGPPRSKKEILLNKKVLQRLLYVGLIMGGGGFINYLLINGLREFGTDLYFQGTTAAFATLVVCQIVNVYAVRSTKNSVFQGFFSNKYIPLSVLFEIVLLLAIVYWQPLQYLLYTKPLDLMNWMGIIAIGLIFWLIEEKSRDIKKQVI